jgi:hypothetical protein
MGRAYQRHREVLKALLQLRARCDAVKSLEQASDRLEKAAQDQLELHLAASRMIARWRTATGKKRSERPRDVAVELRRQGHTQSDLGQDAGVVLKQIAELKPGLPDEHQSRVQEALDAAGKLQVVERIGRAGLALSEVPDRPERDSLAEVFTLQRQAATDLARLGRDVLAPLDKLSALQEVYQRADQALHQLEQISKDTVALAAAESGGEAGQDAADRVARVAYTVRGLVHPLQPHAPELAAKTAPADGELAAAEQLLRSGDPSSAATA